ncbi:unnamed protein product [Rhizoctonia solani]|uniref:VOC domain-containing protein n=1 Tax=Rhizoctonia solani TaxID=456999 RepID=A0A8H2WDR2_9AGAM|nr:unnamed protein product [Rhizoctonia solani]
MPIDHVSNGCISDLQASKAFYEKALAPLGYKMIYDISPYAIGFGTVSYKGDFWLSGPNPEGSRIGEVKNTTHIAFKGTRAQVHAFHEAAIQGLNLSSLVQKFVWVRFNALDHIAGGKCNGPPGFRPQYHPLYYGSFILDPDGNNIE